jgi:hypothetical protein
MSTIIQEETPENKRDITFLDIIEGTKEYLSYFRKFFLTIILIGVFGLVCGLLYSLFKKPNYRAVYTFALEEEGKGGLGQYSSLASLAGIDIGAGGGGIFQGENILELYKSHKMIEETLLSNAYSNGVKKKLIDYYIDVYELRKKWKDEPELKDIHFDGNPDKFNRHQDSIINDLVLYFNKNLLKVIKPDKKLSIIEVNVNSKSEFFSKEFAIALVNNVNRFYVQVKTKKLIQNVNILEKQADSVKTALNNSITGVARSLDASPNSNSLLSILRTKSQKNQVDVQACSAVYGEIVKNLELAKIQLRKETPLIQPIDLPVFPLESDKVGKIKGSLIGLGLGIFLSILFLAIKKTINNIQWK